MLALLLNNCVSRDPLCTHTITSSSTGSTLLQAAYGAVSSASFAAAAAAAAATAVLSASRWLGGMKLAVAMLPGSQYLQQSGNQHQLVHTVT
jgi:hypothetical protein